RETGGDGHSRHLLNAIRRGQQMLATEYLGGRRYRERFAALVEGLLDGRDALALPTLPVVAPAVPAREVELGDGNRASVRQALTALPGAFNCSGSPVVSIPAGLVDGLPVGVSLVGRAGGDHEVVGAGRGAPTGGVAGRGRAGPPPGSPGGPPCMPEPCQGRRIRWRTAS